MNNHDEIRQFAIRVSQRGQDLLSKLDVRDNNPVQITTSILFGKLLNDLDSIVVMVDNGFVDQPFVIARTMLDKLFVISALANDDNKMEELKKHFEHQQGGKVKKACSLGLIDTDEKEARLKELGGSNVRASDWAGWAGMKDRYNREYTLFSDFIHVSLHSIEDCLVREAGKIKAIDMAPDSARKSELLITAAYYILLTTEKVAAYFKITMPDQEEVESVFSRIAKPYFADKNKIEDEQ